MAVEREQEHLSDYERAIYYYTIPRVTSHVTVRVVAVYSALLLAAFGVMGYGLRVERDDFTTGGAVALGVIIVMGILAFLYHAFLNELAEDKALQAAKNIPDADSQFDDIPDPFSGNVLLAVPRHSSGSRIEVVDKKGRVQYVLPAGRDGSTVTVENADGAEVMTLTPKAGGLGFTVSRGTPGGIAVSKSGEPVGRVRRRANFGPEKVEVSTNSGQPSTLSVVGGSVYNGETIVGRVYEVRSNVYLDVKRGFFSDALLAYFLLMA